MVLPQSHRGDHSLTFPAFKRTAFLLEGLNGLASSVYFNYLFFYLSEHFGFGTKGNLLFGAANGLIYTFSALKGGSFAQKRGYLPSLQLGCAIIIGGMLLAAFSNTIALHFAAMAIWTVGISFTWPALEALACEGESAQTLPRKVGLYNLVWSLALAVAYFLGGTLIDRFGWKFMFFFPAAIHLLQIVIVRRLIRIYPKNGHNLPEAPLASETTAQAGQIDRPKAQKFLRMAWLANPFAYIAMNTVVPLIPEVAARLDLSKTGAGFFCSIWMFARTVSFVALWQWSGWHYRFRWLVSSYLLMVIAFAGILLFSKAWLLIVFQVAFGCSVGLIYYSSLFYSMDASDAKGEHGGLHEAALGAGIFAGPAIGVAAIYLWPGVGQASVWAVSAVLAAGLGGLAFLQKQPNR